MSAPLITDAPEALVSQAAPAARAYKEDDVNAFIQSTIHGKPSASAKFAAVKFERAYVRFDEGLVRITYVQSVLGLPLYATTVDAVSIENGQLVVQPKAGTFGRLPIAPRLLPYFNNVFNPLWKVLDRDKNLVARLGNISFHKQRVDLFNKAAAPGH